LVDGRKDVITKSAKEEVTLVDPGRKDAEPERAV
jgi:hypothetical protein